ncbi:arginyltransferase [Cellvibrio sp.]|uniref:arginyltransferase n=1 Tax=Cellvibrio sp. TaxID=1965322 RepID=UPI00396482A0
MTDLSTLKLFATQPHPCSYIDGEQATTVFVDPEATIDITLYSQLSLLGFRRSGGHLYRPQCASCQACMSCRIPVGLFRPNRSQRRCWLKNKDISISTTSRIDTLEHYNLYSRYIEGRHQDGDMYPPSEEQYKAFLTSEWGATRYLEFRLNGILIGVSVCDYLEDGISAVYTFYDAALSERSLGKFAILAQIEKAKELGLSYVYLGYWIKQCEKMNYKTDYRPLELLVNRRWLRLN